MSRLIDADELREKMYHEAFEKDSDMQKWDSGCWIRYKMFENAIDDAPTIEPQQWIPVSERLPEIDVTVLVWLYDNYYLSNLHLIDGILYWDFDDFDLSGEDFEDVVAWMPLPEPYKGGAADGT